MIRLQNIKTRLAGLSAAIFLACLILPTASALAATSVAISSPENGAKTSATSFTVSGSASPDRTITVKVNGVTKGTTTSDGSGNWSLNLSGLSKGAKTIQATASTQFLYANVISPGDLAPGTPVSRLTKINMLNNEEEDAFSIFAGGAFPIAWKPNPSYTKAYGVAPYLNSGTVWALDLVNETVDTFTLPGTGQRGAAIAYNQDGSKVYITDNANSDVVVYDTSDESQIGSAISIGTAPHSNTMRPGTNEIWVDNSSSDNIAVIDADTDTVIHTYATDGGPNGMVFNSDGSRVYVGVMVGGVTPSIAVIDTDTGTTLDTIPTSGTSTQELAISPDGTRLYASVPSADTVDVFDLDTNTLVDSISTSAGPWSLAFNADGSRLYISNPNLFGSLSGTTISVVDTSNNTIIDTITPGNGAPFVIVAFPVESAADSINLTIGGSGTSDELANTGQDSRIVTGAGVLLIVGAGAALAYLRKRNLSANKLT